MRLRYRDVKMRFPLCTIRTHVYWYLQDSLDDVRIFKDLLNNQMGTPNGCAWSPDGRAPGRGGGKARRRCGGCKLATSDFDDTS